MEIRGKTLVKGVDYVKIPEGVYECTNLTSVVFPANWDEAFKGCKGLTSVTFPDSLLSEKRVQRAHLGDLSR